MSKLTKSYKSNFTTVPNSIINDKTISLKAKGIYLFLVSKPDNWSFSAERISTQNSDGLASVKSALKELEEKRFLKRVQANKRGKFGENDYIIFDEPYPLVDFQPTVKKRKPSVEKPLTENRPTLVNKDIVNEERENITSPTPEIIDELKHDEIIVPEFVDQTKSLDLIDIYPYAYEFVNYALNTTLRVHSPLAFKASLIDALKNPNHKKHDMTIIAYNVFVNSRNSCSTDLGDRLFDLYESLGASHV